MSDRIDALIDVKLLRLRFDPARMRRCRLAMGISFVELGGALNVHASTVSAWERGQYLPTDQHAIALEHFMQRAEELVKAGPD